MIFGANYFVEDLTPSMGWIFWDKKLGGDFSDGELIYTSFTDRQAVQYDYTYYGNINSDKLRFHPTQKPIALYRWLLQNYAKTGDKIFDSHVGSGSSLIACIEEGFQYVGCELDEDYFRAASARIETHKEQGRLFAPSAL